MQDVFTEQQLRLSWCMIKAGSLVSKAEIVLLHTADRLQGKANLKV